MKFVRLLLVALTLLLGLSSGQSVILNDTGDPARNTSPPEGGLAGSGWQFQGQWGSFLGTPISPRHFIAAAHVGGTPGDPFIFRGVSYTTIAVDDDPNSDLRIWRVCGVFPDYAPLYEGLTEVGKTFVIFGRGTQRGAPIVLTDLFGSVTKGWFWGPADGAQRWGTNVVYGILNGDAIVPIGGVVGGPVGDLLQATFDGNAGADEAQLSVGDSSGGLFIQDQGVWKLAGINYGVEAYFNTNGSGPGFLAAISDKGGLYSGGAGNWQLTPDLPADLPSALYATRIASNLSWIRGVLDAVPAIDPPPSLESATAVAGPYATEPDAVIDASTRTITLSRPVLTRFFRLNGCEARRLVSFFTNETSLVFVYE